MLEILVHRSGFRPQQEQIATHSRRRYRLKHEPSLWLVCYYQADRNDFRPARSIQPDNDSRRLLTERAHLERSKSQLVRQEFMLHDTAKYPTVSLPGPGGQIPYPQQHMGYPGNVMAQMNRSQYNVHLQQQQQRAMAARAAQAGFGHSPSKRPRHSSSTHVAMSVTGIPMSHAKPKPEVSGEVLDEPEGTVPDALDVLTPRDIALSRYTQHHEWLEEILSSPFDTHRIIPSELGLGRKGELESLTRDFFDAPVYRELVGKKLPDPDNVTNDLVESGQPAVQDEPIARVGKLEGNKAESFHTRATETIAALNAEMETMKRRHEKRMTSLRRGTGFKEAEAKVRMATFELIDGEVEEISPTQEKEVEDLKTALEQKEGGSIVSIAVVECTDKGGQEEVQKKDMGGPQELEDFDMTGTDTFDLDGAQLQTPPEPTAPRNVVAEQPTSENNAMPPSAIRDEAEQSSTMQNGQMQKTQQHSETIDAPTGAEDYVMVSKADARPADAGEPARPTDLSDYPEPIDQNTAEDLPGFDHSQQDSFEPNDFGGDSIDFGDMDTAGDELSGYAQEIANMNAGSGDQNDIGLDSPAPTGIVPENAGAAEQSHHPGI